MDCQKILPICGSAEPEPKEIFSATQHCESAMFSQFVIDCGFKYRQVLIKFYGAIGKDRDFSCKWKVIDSGTRFFMVCVTL